ncbi:anaphase-promoting complex subunit 1 [Salmo salar]|uniref:Anaphase-promoting complex subunit 1 n=1 Tax=Salmo salar TaxID=8030 RepID=A0A1S3N4S1_SALSA|nr:anaphase-promoting complex subunit 1 [Salmo salar]XP_045556929.1 anaphase-promoting complex subunit 1-like [Salmo salar]|eukprot:XP_014010320.1 PREDICTED: anaphase-promoting complex subunit 1 [Salmo salar]
MMSLQQKVRKCWLLRKGSSVDSDENEEELYAAGNMVIWSRGSKSQASHVYKVFTVGSPVLQDVMEQIVCIVPRSCVNVHSVTPKDLISPLHFQGTSSHCICSMLHPLDESGVQTYRSVRGCLCAIRL